MHLRSALKGIRLTMRKHPGLVGGSLLQRAQTSERRALTAAEVSFSVETSITLAVWPPKKLQELVEGVDLSALPDLERVAPASIPQHLPSSDCGGPVGVALWLPDQDGVSPEGGHPVLHEQAPDVLMDVRGGHGVPFSVCWIRHTG